MVNDVKFVEDKKGNITIDPSISIKLCDFGVSEVFRNHQQQTQFSNAIHGNIFQCDKQGLNLEYEAYLSPKQVAGDIYNAHCADIWSLGIILFQSLTNEKLYEPLDIHCNNNKHNGYWALCSGKLAKYLKRNNLSKYFNDDSFQLLSQLLCIDEEQRISGINILTNPWFNTYFSRYQPRITKKFNQQRKQLLQQREKMRQFPFYRLL